MHGAIKTACKILDECGVTVLAIESIVEEGSNRKVASLTTLGVRKCGAHGEGEGRDAPDNLPLRNVPRRTHVKDAIL